MNNKNYSNDIGWFKSVSIDEASIPLNNFKYKMLYIDTSNHMDIEKRKLFIDFGNNIANYGVVVEISNESDLEKKRFLSKIFDNLNTSYQYYDSPFLVFVKRRNKGFYPFKILSFSDITNKCILKSLQRVENNIHKNTPEEELTPFSEEYKIKWCSLKDKDIFESLIDTLKDIINKR